jgi:septum formation protein
MITFTPTVYGRDDVPQANAIQQKLVLASSSPRRAELLNSVGWPFEVAVAGIDESRLDGEDPVTYVQRLARSKAETVAAQLERGLVLGADTTVVVGEEMLGQPRDEVDARRMLRLLSGKWHDVLTGVAFVIAEDRSRTLVDFERTRVRFAEMSANEIDWYVATGEATGKAGAYGIQGKAGIFIEEIQGDYFNIVGLPIRLVYTLAKRICLL